MEVIPRNYKLYQKHRKDGYAGVLIGIKFNLVSKLNFNSYILWNMCSCDSTVSKSTTCGNQWIYRLPNRDVKYQQELCDCIYEIVISYPNSFIFCAEDFISIFWILAGLVANSIINHQYPLYINRFILTMAAECYFIQLVNLPTHRENILDIVFTNWSSFVNRYTVILGVSDPDAVLVSFIASATYEWG